MSVTISLNRQALHDLIDKDPEFNLELKNAVLAEVARRIFEKDFKRVIEQSGPDLFRQAVAAVQADHNIQILVTKALNSAIVDPGQYYNPTLKPDVRARINEAVEAEKNKVITTATAELAFVFDNRAKEVVKKWSDEVELNDRVEKRVNRLTEEAINKMVDEKVEARLAEIKRALA